MSDNCFPAGTCGKGAETEAAPAVPPEAVNKPQLPEDRARGGAHVLQHVERSRTHRLSAGPALPGDWGAMHALLLTYVSLTLFPVMLLQAFAVVQFGTGLADLLTTWATGLLFGPPVLFSLASTVLLCVLAWRRLEMTDEGRRDRRDAWRNNLIVLGTALVSFGLLWIVEYLFVGV